MITKDIRDYWAELSEIINDENGIGYDEFISAMKEYAERGRQNLADLLDELPENRPLYKDSGLWQQRSDDMEDVYYQQKHNEKTEDFIKRLYEARNDR